MPHCPMELYNNVIAANIDNLRNILILGNSIVRYDIMAVDRNKYEVSVIQKIVMENENLITEWELGELPQSLADVFFNTFLVSFEQDLGSEFGKGENYYLEL